MWLIYLPFLDCIEVIRGHVNNLKGRPTNADSTPAAETGSDISYSDGGLPGSIGLIKLEGSPIKVQPVRLAVS